MYVGPEVMLFGTTALGMQTEDGFAVQVDELSHCWSHGWHPTPERHWKLIKEVSWPDQRNELSPPSPSGAETVDCSA